MNLSDDFLSKGLTLSKPIVLGLLALVLLAWIGMTMVFVFHWKRYGMRERFVVLAESVYFFVSAVLIALSVWFYFAI